MTSIHLPVYRVQGPDGRGPWRPGWSHVWIDGDAPVGRLTQTVMDLVPVAVIRALPPELAYGSACRTVAELMEWFTLPERRALAGFGFHPVRLTVDVLIAASDWQLFVGRRRPFVEGATRLRWPS